MRKDIELHIQTGDVALDAQNKLRLRTFKWVDDDETAAMLSRYIYGEIDVPYSVSTRTIQNNGLYFEVPYTPKYKEFKLRIRRVYEDGTYEYLQNEVDGSHWFLAQTSLYGTGLKNVYASMLPAISETSFYASLHDGIAEIYSSSQSDFNIVKANRQNANCLLACFPGGNYRYPLTGVGLARWINSTNVISTDLTTVLQDEFSADGVTVKNAAYNYDTQQMELDLSVQEDD
jgi:hypothetical protein